MKKLFLLCLLAIVAGCNQVDRLTDSEISAIRDQTKAIEKQTNALIEQNKILKDISNKIGDTIK